MPHNCNYQRLTIARQPLLYFVLWLFPNAEIELPTCGGGYVNVIFRIVCFGMEMQFYRFDVWEGNLEIDREDSRASHLSASIGSRDSQHAVAAAVQWNVSIMDHNWKWESVIAHKQSLWQNDISINWPGTCLFNYLRFAINRWLGELFYYVY